MKNLAKTLTVGELANVPNDNMLSNVMLTDETNILSLITEYNRRLQSATGEEKENIQVHRDMLYNILDGMIEVTHSIFSASIDNGSVKEPARKGSMTVVENKSTAKKEDPKKNMELSIVDKFIKENKVLFKPNEDLYSEMLNVDDFSGVLANKELNSSQEAEDKLINAFFGVRKFTKEAIDKWYNVRKEMYPNMTLDDHFVLLYEGSKLTPNLNSVIEDNNALLINTMRNYSDISGKVSDDYKEDDWDEVEDLLTYQLVGSVSKDGKKPRSLNVARNFAKMLIKSIAKDNETVATNVVDDNAFADDVKTEVENPTPTYVAKISEISAAIAAETGQKRDVVKKIVKDFFYDDKGETIVETDVVDDFAEGKVIRTIKSKRAAMDFIFKTYASVHKELDTKVDKTEAKDKAERTPEVKKEETDKFEEPVITSINDIKPMGEKLIANGYTMDDLKEWAKKYMLNKQLKEQSKGAEFKKPKVVEDLVEQFFSSYFQSDNTSTTEGETKVAFDDVKGELLSFLKDEFSKDNTLKVGTLKDRAVAFLEEKSAEYKLSDVINVIKEAVPSLWHKKDKAKTKADKTETSTNESNTREFLTKKIKERIDNGAKSVAQVKFMLKKQAKIDKWANTEARDLVKDPNTNLVNEIYEELTGKTTKKPGPVQTKEIKTEKAPAVEVDKKPAETKSEDEDFGSDEETKVVEKFSTKYPKIWDKVVNTSTEETLLKNCRVALKKFGEADAVSLFEELRENVESVKNLSNGEAVKFFNEHVLGKKSKSEETQTEKPTEETPKNPFVEIGSIHDKKKFKERLANIFKEHEDNQELRQNLMNAIRGGKGKYVKQLDKSENTLTTMFNKAKRIAKEEE